VPDVEILVVGIIPGGGGGIVEGLYQQGNLPSNGGQLHSTITVSLGTYNLERAVGAATGLDWHLIDRSNSTQVSNANVALNAIIGGGGVQVIDQNGNTMSPAAIVNPLSVRPAGTGPATPWNNSLNKFAKGLVNESRSEFIARVGDHESVHPETRQRPSTFMPIGIDAEHNSYMHEAKQSQQIWWNRTNKGLPNR
jgi:hypothetical protein